MNTLSDHQILRAGACALVFSLLAACATEQVKESQEAPAASKPVPLAARPAPAAPRVVAQPVAPKPAAVNPLNDPNNILSRRSVYYDYDEYTVKPEFRPLLEAHAMYLKQHPGASVTIEGNCDERGSREYNLALGQKRAEGVQRQMILMGAGSGQIEAISYGEEKPKALGHDEKSWAQNRHSDIVYKRAQ
ncbi:MAG: peptidoglycan-associated lipoprotein Pal [Betaproteobacteria bacterium]|nr:peptidoglycan-associated lipoprotein Pal [Betaproteobacteria bacterium]